ncbi:hypothetical protein L2E82_47570 [Cichorium intybus]|uniref:Uncharacterized protein n=1 Tax=Cichorium intybus TaxID=13427 RepID=A0ACB8YWE3_CICIN|nr:hypothetical protein L2E82_47570 [Cichorium intybus]
MEAKVVVVSGIVLVLGIISVVAGFAAETTRIRESEVLITRFSCVYPSTPTPRLGILALTCTIITRIILLMVVGCCCRRSGSTSTQIYSFINILSWTMSVVAVILFLAGVVLNNRKSGQQEYNGMLTCYVVKPGIFAARAIISFFSTFFGIVSYFAVSSSTQTTSQLDIELPVAADVDVEKSPVHP